MTKLRNKKKSNDDNLFGSNDISEILMMLLIVS